MKHAALTVAVFLTLLPMALARIGETPEQTAERYGQPVPVTDKIDGPAGAQQFDYLKGPFRVSVIFWNGKAHKEVFQKTDKTDFSDTETGTLLEANSFGAKWTSELQNSRFKEWSWGNGRLSAVYYANLRIFIIETSECKKATEEAKTQQEKDGTKGF